MCLNRGIETVVLDATGSEQQQTRKLLYVTEDRLQVLLDIHPDVHTKASLLKEVPEIWASLRLPTPFDSESFARTVDAVLAEGQAVTLCLLSGTPPHPPVHGRIEWGGPYFEQGFEIDAATGVVNYRRRMARTTVAEKECLAVLHPPVEGVPGLDVFGKSIPAYPARRALLDRGDNVYLGEGGSQFFAARQGHIRLLGNRLCVDETYSLPGVGLKSGDIDHPGALEVNGDVEPGSHVRTTGNIYIAGIVEEASIDCGGDLTVAGGIVGAEDKHIHVVGNLHARYLAHATVDVDGDIVVEREIDQCHVRCRGSVSVPEGRIVGGHVTARGGIMVNEAGSHGAVSTLLCAGEDDRIHERLHEVREEIARHSHAVARIREALTPLLPHEEQLDSRQKEAMEHLKAKQHQLSESLRSLEEEERTLHEKGFLHHGHRIDVRSWLYSDVVLSLGGHQLRVEEALKGPLHALQSEEGIRLAPGIAASQR